MRITLKINATTLAQSQKIKKNKVTDTKIAGIKNKYGVNICCFYKVVLGISIERFYWRSIENIVFE